MTSSAQDEAGRGSRRLQRTLRLDFAPTLYDELEEIAEERDVSVGGVVREFVARGLRECRGASD